MFLRYFTAYKNVLKKRTFVNFISDRCDEGLNTSELIIVQSCTKYFSGFFNFFLLDIKLAAVFYEGYFEICRKYTFQGFLNIIFKTIFFSNPDISYVKFKILKIVLRVPNYLNSILKDHNNQTKDSYKSLIKHTRTNVRFVFL